MVLPVHQNGAPPSRSDLTNAPAVLEKLDARTAEAVRGLFAEAAAENTTRSYRAALAYWEAWYRLRYGVELTYPVTPEHVITFIMDHVPRQVGDGVLEHQLPPEVERGLLEAQVKKMAGPLRLTTVTHRVAVLSTAHQIKGFESPCKRDAVKLVLKQARRAVAKRDERPRQKTAITRTELMAMLATCDDSLEGIRDRALLHFGFGSGGRRRSEIAAADMRDLRRVEPTRYLYRLTHSKTRQNGGSPNDNKDKPINGVNADALTRWLEASGITEGRIFRRVRKSVLGAPLSPKAVAEIVRRRALKAGLVGDFAGHSLRSGFVTEAGRRGIHLRQVMAMTDHKSVASVLGYFQTGEAAANPAASILDDE